MMQTHPDNYIIGITGGSASGKTSFLKRLTDSFSSDELTLISQDNYYLEKEKQPKDGNGVENYDTPDSIDFDMFCRDIQNLRKGNTVQRMEYTFNNPNITPKLLTYKPAPIIIVEGIFVLYNLEVTRLLDLKLYIESKEWLKLKRRIIRDKVERGYDLNDVLYRWEHHVTPTYERYILPFRESADLIIQNNHGFDGALNVLTSFFKSHLREHKIKTQSVK